MDACGHADRAKLARLMLYQAARSRGPDNSAFPDPMLSAQAKIFASETAIRIVNDALQIFGARSYSRISPRTHGTRCPHVYDWRWNCAGAAHSGGFKNARMEAAANPRRLRV